MVGDSVLALILSEVVLACLVVLCLVRGRTIRRSTHLASRSRSSAALIAAVFGALAVVSLGVVIPLDTIDRLVGSTNFTNLIQSLLTVCAFWFFRIAVKAAVFPAAPRFRVGLLLVLLTCIAVPFLFIEDRGPTSAQFMAEHADQLSNVAYNVVYMAVLGWVVIDMVWVLRKQGRGFAAFRVGLALVALSCVDEIAYVVVAYLSPGGIATALYHLFYALFFGGILVVAVGWFWVILSERGYSDSARWRLRCVAMARVLLRTRALASRTAEEPETGRSIAPRAPGDRQPRLIVARYITPSSTRMLSSIPADSWLSVLRTFLGRNSEDVAYRLVVEIRNTATRHLITLHPSDAARVRAVENQFPGF